MTSMVEVRGLNKTLGAAQILCDVDLDVARNEVLAIIGPSGSGKSTLLRCLNFLEAPSSGSIRIDGNLLGYADTPDGRRIRLGEREVNRQRAEIGMVFQQFNLWPHRTVLENIIEAPILVRGAKTSEATAAALALLDRVGLADKAAAYPATLSGGQQQRVAIARSLAMKPKLMLFDEVTSALDPEMVREVLDVIRDVSAQGMTMVLVTHEMGFAREVAHRVLFMDGGRVIEHGAPQLFFTAPRERRTQAFLAKILH